MPRQMQEARYRVSDRGLRENRFHWLALATGPDGKSTALEGKTMRKVLVSVRAPMMGDVVLMSVAMMQGCDYRPLIETWDGAPFVAVVFH
ncbi:hypothetical protein JRG10_06480 [Pseudomonas fulva]|nr:hypothetical protein [Pseudomonas fulva]